MMLIWPTLPFSKARFPERADRPLACEARARQVNVAIVGSGERPRSPSDLKSGDRAIGSHILVEAIPRSFPDDAESRHNLEPGLHDYHTPQVCASFDAGNSAGSRVRTGDPSGVLR